MLIGHSLGGLMVIYSLLNYNNLFNSYLAIDPSLWYDDQIILKQAQQNLDTKDLNGKRLYIAMANTLPQNVDTLQIRIDTSLTKGHPVSILEFIDLLRNKSKNGLLSDWKYYDQDNHGSVPLIATYDALHFFFDFYRLPSYEVIVERIDNIDSLLTTYSDRLSKNLGYKTLLPESFINTLAYMCLGNKM